MRLCALRRYKMRYGALYGFYAALCLRGAYARLTRGLCDYLKFWNINYEMREKNEKRLVCCVVGRHKLGIGDAYFVI